MTQREWKCCFRIEYIEIQRNLVQAKVVVTLTKTLHQREEATLCEGDDIQTGYHKKDKTIMQIFSSETFINYFISLLAYNLSMCLMRSPNVFEKIAILKM